MRAEWNYCNAIWSTVRMDLVLNISTIQYNVHIFSFLWYIYRKKILARSPFKKAVFIKESNSKNV